MLNKSITTMLCITALIALALCLGHDGALLAAGCALLAGLGGYQAGKHFND